MGRVLRLCTLTILVSLALVGCRSQRDTVREVSQAAESQADYDAMVAACRQWQRIRVPFTLKILAPQKASIGGTATFDRGNSIYMSLRMLGMEVAVVDINSDSLCIAEKMNRQYLSVPVASALGGLDASIDNIQDLLTGRAFILGADSLTLALRDRFKISATAPGEPWLLTPRKQPSGAKYSFAVNPAGSLAIMTVDTSGGQRANATFGSPVITDTCGPFASSVLVTTKLKDKDLELIIEWDFGRAKFDNEVELKNLKIGSNYRRLDPQALLKNLPATTN